jgi:hypothetical protein
MGRPRDIRALKSRNVGKFYTLNRIVYRHADFRCECGGKIFDKVGKQKSIEHKCVACEMTYLFVPSFPGGGTIF